MPFRFLRFALVLPLVLATVSPAAGRTAAAASGTPYSFNWTTTQPLAQPWNPATGFDVVVHDRDFTQTYEKPYPFLTQHGTDCSPFQGFGVGGTHMVTTYADSVFVCNNHLMTGINGQGYGEVAFTPAEMLDWSSGPVKVTWQVDTLRTSCRDWLSFNVMPFADNLMLTDGIGVDLFHEPKNELLFSTGANCSNAFTGSDIRNFNGTDIPGPGGAVEDVVDTTSATAAKVRQIFELDISSTHVRFGMPAFNKWFVDGNLASPLPYSQGVIQFEQHSYTPDKQCNPTPTFCAANTWHWSNISISNGVPFTILRANRFQVAGGHTADGVPDTINLPAPAPANSFLRFQAISAAGSVRFSTNGGASWITPTHQQPSQDAPDGALTDSKACLYFWPIPAGATQVKFDARDASWTWNAIRNISVWSPAPGSGVTNQPPAPTPTPAPPTPPPPTPAPLAPPTPDPAQAAPAGGGLNPPTSQVTQAVAGATAPGAPGGSAPVESTAPQPSATLDVAGGQSLVAHAASTVSSWQTWLTLAVLGFLIATTTMLVSMGYNVRRTLLARRRKN